MNWLEKPATWGFKVTSVILMVVYLVIFTIFLLWNGGLIWAGEKEELQWKGKALIAEFQLRQQQFNEANAALEAFVKELDAKGFMFQNNQIIEKPKPDVKKEEPKKEKK